jgi:ribose 5-phosphate isomerase B
MKTFVVGSDHGGIDVKTAVIALLKQRGAQVVDAGTNGPASVDYPDFGVKVAGMVSRGEADQGVLVCGTGIGMSMVANKFPGVRAALVTDEFMARMSREHNNANVLVLGGRVVDVSTAEKLVSAWLDAIFEGGRHQSRLDKITALERQLGLVK